MARNKPLVSIGMPVYNGDRYLRLALDSLLAQDYENFDLIISDNASTDKTQEICLEYAAKDSRIRYYRNQVNVGASENFKVVVDLATSEYFMWAAHDDLWDKNYVFQCLEKLEAHPYAVLCCTEIVFINEDNSVKANWTAYYKNIDTLGMDIPGRVHQLINRVGWYAIYGLIRSSSLRKVVDAIAEQSYGSDVIFLLKLLLLGDFVKVPEPLFYYRVPDIEKTAEQHIANVAAPEANKRIPDQPYSYLAREILKVVFNSQVGEAVKRQIQADFIETLTSQNFDWQRRILIEQSFSLRSDVSPQEQQGLIRSAIASALSIAENEQERSIEVGGSASMSLDVLLANIQSLPPDWHTGGALSREVLQAIVRHVGSRQLLHSVETGSGASTLLLSHLSKDHKVFSYDCGSNGLSVVRSSGLLNKENVEFIEGPTQITLPPYKFENKIELALIDGPHGYPFPDLEYYFIYPHLEENALLIIDDIWIPNIANLFNFLREDAMFELIDIVGKTAFLRRTNAQLLNPVGDDWFLQNYNKNRFPITSFENIYSYSEAAKIENKKALVFFPHKPYPPRTGAHQRCLSMLGGLKKLGYDVTLFGSNLITDNPWPVDSTQELQELQEQLGVKVEVYQGTQADRQFMAQVMEQMQARGELVNWDFYTPPGLRERFRQVFAQLTPDLIMINYSLWGKLATGNEFRSALRVMDMIDLYTLNMQMRQALALNLSTAPFTPEQTDPTLVEEDLFLKLQLDALPEEYGIFDQYDCTIAISPREAQAIKEHTQRTSVEYIPMTFATESLANTYSGAPLFAVGPNSFNIQGYLYFATKVLPIVRRQLPEFSLRVVGSSCNQLVAVDGMQLLGFVPDLKPLYCESRFAICPLIGGTGQQVKIVEAMAHGIPVIALRNVAGSSPIEHGVNGFIADNAEEFAQYTIELFGDRELCRKLGQAARETIAKDFSQDILLSKLKAVTEKHKIERLSPIIVIDAVFFQLYKTGIARVWQSLLEEWAENGFAQHIVVLDRAGTAPKISSIQYRSVPPYDYGATDDDRKMLQEVCDEQDADLFISTYYTTPLSTPSVFMAYDMIPEVMEWDLANPMWSEKNHGIQEASAYLAISESTARDLVKFFPHISPESVTVAHCGVKSTFSPASLEEVNQFKTKYGISKPYFIIVGTGGYKNTILFFQAFSQLHSRESFEIVCTGSGGFLQDEFRAYTSGSVVHMLQLSDRELMSAYSGAVALVYPSKYEGFGLPILEALACGCPVITCRNASIPEVAGEAAIYVNDADANELANAFCDILQKPEIRGSLIAAGLEQAKKFSWAKMARTVSSVLIDTTLLALKLRDINLIIFPDWSQPEELLCVELAQVIKRIAAHPERSQMTLLIHTGNISEEDANLVLSAVTMDLLMQEDLDVTEGVQISFVGHLGEIQWKALLARLQARIVLESENQDAIALVGAENLQACQLDSLA